MRAIVKKTGGPGVQLQELVVPQPGPTDVLIRVRAIGICGGDIGIYDSDSSGESDAGRPFVPGHETSGEIVKIGERVNSFAEGDRIAVETHIPCLNCYSCHLGYLNLCDNLRVFGVTRGTNGAFADYAVVPSVVAYKIPAEVSDEEGAVLEPLGVGVHAVKKSGLVVGDSAAVLGCGPIGLFIIALLRIGGAAEIIATDVSEYRLRMAEKIGATVTIDAGHADVLHEVGEITKGIWPRLVFEASGNSRALIQAFDMVGKRGKLVLVAGHSNTPPLNFAKNVHLKEVEFEGIYGREIWDTWNRSTELVKRKMIDVRPLITHRFPLEKVDEAIALAKKAEAGKILVVP